MSGLKQTIEIVNTKKMLEWIRLEKKFNLKNNLLKILKEARDQRPILKDCYPK